MCNTRFGLRCSAHDRLVQQAGSGGRGCCRLPVRCDQGRVLGLLGRRQLEYRRAIDVECRHCIHQLLNPVGGDHLSLHRGDKVESGRRFAEPATHADSVIAADQLGLQIFADAREPDAVRTDTVGKDQTVDLAGTVRIDSVANAVAAIADPESIKIATEAAIENVCLLYTSDAADDLLQV